MKGFRIFRIESKETNRHLDRIATALELILKLQYDYNVDVPIVDTSGEPASVEYSSDLTTLREEVEEFLKGQNVQREGR